MRQEILNKKLPTLLEVIRGANESDDPVGYLKKAISEDSRIVNMLGYATNPTSKFPLPEGIPPYIPTESPIGLAEVELLHLYNKLYVLFNQGTPKAKKEHMFIQWLEKMNPEEAEILIAIKGQDLSLLYPNITEYVLVDTLGWDRKMYESLKKK
jgi:hypothetical protein